LGISQASNSSISTSSSRNALFRSLRLDLTDALFHD
jgi:hypothetical protein